MDEAIQVSCIIDKLPHSWKNFKHTLKHLKEELTLIELGSHLRIKESLKMHDSDNPKDNNVVGNLVVNMVEHNNSSRYNDNKGKRGKVDNKANASGTNDLVDGSTNSLKGQNMFNKSFQVYYVTYVSEAYFVQDNDIAWLNIVNDNIGSAFMSTSKQNDSILWHARLGHVHFKRTQDMSKDGLIPGIKCIFVGYAKHSKAFRFYVIEPNNLVSINFINESMDAIFDENRLSLVPRPSLRIPNGTKYIGSSVVPEEVTKEDDPKIFDEAMKSHDVAFWKEAIDDEMDSIMGNNTWVLADLPPSFLNGDLDEEVYMNQPHGFIMPGNENKVDLTKEFLSSRFSMKDMGEADVILVIRIKHESNGISISQSYYIEKVLKKFNNFDCTPVSTPMDTSEKLMPNNGQAVSQLEYSRVIGCLMYAMTCTRLDITFAVSKLSRYTSNPGTQHWQAIQRVLKYLKKIMDHKLTYIGYPSVLEGYTDAS
ncbi:zinc finger, CCHC-type containing protein [Tanacetum coccineum]|uniref:Zinc finger, CCHC-type containing protein n=1 Tax=Tanacetum coccineum TaxID=301880 RepID=A0ABQ4YBK4_9ASTR